MFPGSSPRCMERRQTRRRIRNFTWSCNLSERVRFHQQTSFSQPPWGWKISTFSSWSCCCVFCLNDFSLWACMLYECVTVTDHCIYAQGVGGCCKSPTEFNWLVSAKCGRGLTSMFRSASWEGRCKIIHQLSGKEHTALPLCCPLLLLLCSSALDGIFASSGPCVSL